jgi:RIO kinase 1
VFHITDEIPELVSFEADDWITDVVARVKSGKEATIYACKAHQRLGVDYLAAKVYSDRLHRSFKNDAIYQEGRTILDQRVRRAVKAKTDLGRSYQARAWVQYEYETLELLYSNGSDVPMPYTRSSNVILMEYVGDADMSAPPLRLVDLGTEEAAQIFDQLMSNIELWLSCDRIHGDLSPFNILYWQGAIKVIDFPQAVDPRFNSNGFALLSRDVSCLCNHFAEYGVTANADSLVNDLWTRYTHGRL